MVLSFNLVPRRTHVKTSLHIKRKVHKYLVHIFLRKIFNCKETVNSQFPVFQLSWFVFKYTIAKERLGAESNSNKRKNNKQIKMT